MVRFIRTSACLMVATATALVGWVWLKAPHDSSDPTDHLSATYNTAVGLADLYLFNDHRGYERLVALDPDLVGVGGEAARKVATDDTHFSLQARREATVLLAEREALDPTLAEELAVAAIAHGENSAFCQIMPDLDTRLGCGG